MQSLEDLKSIPVMMPGQSQPYLGDVATITTPKMPGEIDRYNGQRVISLPRICTAYRWETQSSLSGEPWQSRKSSAWCQRSDAR